MMRFRAATNMSTENSFQFTQTAFQDFIARPIESTGEILSAVSHNRFLVLPALSAPTGSDSLSDASGIIDTTLQASRFLDQSAVITVPSMGESQSKVRVLQQWNGIVEGVEGDRFFATISDRTNSSNPLEYIEMDLSELSESDRPLAVAGATFYWSIAYRDSPAGQRERLSSLRFARQPHVTADLVDRVFERADALAALLESD
jgi:hypothetical protein